MYTGLCNTWRVHAKEIDNPYPRVESPTMIIENRVFTNRHWRKIHVERAQVGDLSIVHQVAYPWAEREIPIFGLDVLSRKDQGVMAIADFSLDPQHPHWASVMQTCASHHQLKGRQRELPEWGSIFSDSCIFVQQPDPDEFKRFALRLQKAYIQNAWTMGICRHKDHSDYHKKYALAQRKNDKTKNMLAASFGIAWAEEYMRFMFDYESQQYLSTV